jgi:hypothetical protein
VFGHDLDLLAGRDLLQFDELGQQPPDRHGISDRQLRTAAFGYLKPDLVAGQEAEPPCNRIDQRRIVARHHAEVIADTIRDTLRQLHLDMPGRAVGRVGAGLVLQLGIDLHLHRRDAALRHDGVDRGRRHRLDGVERRIIGAARDARCEAEFLGGRGSRGGKPFFELAIEVAAGIALAARIDAAPAMRRQLLVDHARHRLIGRRPVAVAATEHGVADVCECVLGQLATQPFDELRGVVGRRAIIGGAEDQHAAFVRQLARELIHRRQLCREAIDLGEIGDASGQIFRGAEVGAIEHQ